MSLVSLRAVNKSYAGVDVLKNIELSVTAGERVVLVGRSGSGKTTILRLICDLEQVTSGQVLVAKHGYTIGYVPQSPSLLHAQTVRDNILLPVKATKAKLDIQQTYRTILKTLGIEALEDRYPYQLSRGQAQRVALARGLILQPKLLVLDEPFASLDEFTKEDLDVELLRLNQELGTAILLVTHSIEEAVFVANTVYVLSKDMQGLKKIPIQLPRENDKPAVKGTKKFIEYVATVRNVL